MGKRIRTIWMLSLASAMLLIGVQGYWLYNQYQYVVNTYAQDLSEKILNAGEKELKKRNSGKSSLKFKGNYDRIIDSLFEGTSKREMVLYNITGSSDEMREIQIFDARASEARLEMRMSDFVIKFMHPDSVKRDGFISGDSLGLDKKNIPESLYDHHRKKLVREFGQDSDAYTESSARYFSINPKIPENYINKGVEQAVINNKVPFSEELLDSILVADIPGIEYTMTPMGIQDSIVLSSWHHSGSLFSPYIKVLYMYSIFENEGVEIVAAIPSPPLFNRMAVQLLLSLSLILLLIGCLIFQIRTILKQQKINEMREGFVNTMIHELKRPVQTLKTFISFLGNKEMRSDETITEQVIQDSMFELDNLSAYLKKLKDMIRADNDVTSLQISRFNIRELIEKIIRLAKSSTTKDINISILYESDLLWVEADAVHVANVLNNLIENAVKYSGERVDIEIKAAIKGKELWLTVSDNGIGIPYSEKDKVFAKFYRGSNIPDKNIPGIGLGLSYVKLIIEAHKGKVSLLSDVGKGTSVTLSLPQ